jgi:hypothetical protein
MTTLISKRIVLWVFVLATGVFWLPATSNSGGWKLDRETKSEKSTRNTEEAANSEDNAPLVNNSGDLKFSYNKRQRFRGSAAMHSALISQKALDGIVGELKEQIALPFDIKVIFDECGDAEAYYDEDTHEIVLCYELIDSYYHLFSHSRALRARSARNEAAKGATVSIFLHELAHALIDGWELPITGREEDAADQFSTLLLINGMRDGEQMALDTAHSFKLLADLEKGQEKVYSDSHSLDEQRFYDTICLIYGHRPEKYEYLIENGTLPVDRAVDCAEYYARVNKSWQALLAPHFVSRKAGSLEFDTLGFP